MFRFLILLCALHHSYGAVIPKATGCKIVIDQHLSDPQPVLLLQNDALIDIEAIVLPEDGKGTITFKKGEAIDVGCPGGDVVALGTSLKKEIVEIACSSGINFKMNGKIVPFPNITCSKSAKSEARYTGKKCAKKYKEIQIGFQMKDRFITHILTCYDEKLQNSLYSVSHLPFNIEASQANFPRPGFQVSNFYYAEPNVATLYSRKGQVQTINGILGLKENDPSVIHPTSNVYLATGHYTPKADFVFGAQQRLTFYYVNAAPQWQNINGGNWNVMERNYRSLAAKRQLDFIVYTGSHGIMSHPDVKGKEQELYLWVGNNGERGIPVPAFFYKVIYEPISQQGIALISRNNPYKKIEKSDYICKDVCDKVKWLTWKQENTNLGFVYCCNVDDFRKSVNSLPKFTVKSLLI